MQSVFRIKQVSRLRLSLVAFLTWPISVRSVRLYRACRTGPMKCRTTMRGVWRLHRIFRAAHRSRHRRCHTPRISDRLAMDDSQDWEKKMTLLLSSSQSRELVLTRRRSSLALKGACSTLRVVQSPRSPRARPRDKAKHRSDATAFSRHAS